MPRNRPANKEKSPYYGALSTVVEDLFALSDSVDEDDEPTVRRLDVIMAAEAADLPDDLLEVVNLLPPGTYTHTRLCTQLNSIIGGHAWGQVYGTV